MRTLKIKYLNETIKRLEMPREGDVGIDIYASEDIAIEGGATALIPTGVTIEPPKGYWIQIIDRSSVSKYGHVMAGIIDETYRGEVKVRMYCHGGSESDGKRSLGLPLLEIEKGDKIAQLIIRKNFNRDFEIEEVDELTDTDRGDGGFGSTGG